MFTGFYLFRPFLMRLKTREMNKCGGVIVSEADRTKSTCSPTKRSLVVFRFYYIFVPILLFVLFVESVVILMSLPGGFASAITSAATKSLPAIGAGGGV